MAEGVVQVVSDGPRHQAAGRRGSPEGDLAPSGADATGDGLPLPALLVVTALAAAAFGQGAYYRSGQWMVGALLAGAAAALVGGPGAPTRAPRPLLAACAALAGWSVISAVAAGQPAAALGTVLVLAGGVVVVVTCQSLDGAGREQMTGALVGLGLAVALTGWAGVAWHRSPWALPDQGLWRAATTLTYANVAAGFLAVVGLLTLARVAAPARPILPVLSSCVVLTGLGATLSRGGCIAFVAGVLVLARLLGPRVLLRVAAPPALGAVVALAGLWPSIPASASARPALAIGGLAVGLLVAAATSRLAPRALVVLALAVVLAVVALAAGPGGDASRRITGPRFTMASSDRVGEARAALRVAAERPLLGSGPGMADLSWEREGGGVLTARYAHNEYLQVLAEMGVVGLSLLVALLAVIARAVRRGRPRAPALPGGSGPVSTPSTWAGGAAGLVALGVHGLFDFGWHLPAIALTGALLVGIVTTNEKEADQ